MSEGERLVVQQAVRWLGAYTPFPITFTWTPRSSPEVLCNLVPYPRGTWYLGQD